MTPLLGEDLKLVQSLKSSENLELEKHKFAILYVLHASYLCQMEAVKEWQCILTQKELFDLRD